MSRIITFLILATSAIFAADAISGQVEKQPLNMSAIVMFLIFVGATLGITYWAAKKTKSAKDFYTAGGGITGFQNGISNLNREMKNEKNKLKLENEDFQSFKDMHEISSRIYEYLNKFNEETLKGITGEDKEKKVIKGHYWIDMLEGIYDISDDYVNVQWKIEATDIE